MTTTSPLGQLEAVINTGRAVISADDDTIVAIVQHAIASGASATFYLSSAQSERVRLAFFTPERVAELGMHQVSDHEAARIRTELGIENANAFRCNRITCECGEVYGAFEFLQQGISEHGGDIVRALFSADNFAMVNANRQLVEVCPTCDRSLLAVGEGFTYDCDHYGGCCFEED